MHPLIFFLALPFCTWSSKVRFACIRHRYTELKDRNQPVQIFLSPLVVLLSFISRFALVRWQIDSKTTASEEKIWPRRRTDKPFKYFEAVSSIFTVQEQQGSIQHPSRLGLCLQGFKGFKSHIFVTIFVREKKKRRSSRRRKKEGEEEEEEKQMYGLSCIGCEEMRKRD